MEYDGTLHDLSLELDLLFDKIWYNDQMTTAYSYGDSTVDHYLETGHLNGFNPHPLFDGIFYLKCNPDVEAAGVNPLVHFLRDGWGEGRNPHPLFDVRWYLERNPDVAAAGVNPLIHYIRDGYAEGRDPHPLFSILFYCSSNGDIDISGVNPLIHYICEGAGKLLNPNLLFDSKYYMSKHACLPGSCTDALVHYVVDGFREGKIPHPLFDPVWYINKNQLKNDINPLEHYLTVGLIEYLDPNPLFDVIWYCRNNAVAFGSATDAIAHYLHQDAGGAHDPHPLFDVEWYARNNPSIVQVGSELLGHYLSAGAFEGRSPHPLFDAAWYLERNPDVAEAGINPLIHYISNGASEKRDPNCLFDSDWYLAKNPDVAAAGMNPLIHYRLYGAERGSEPSRRFSSAFYVSANRLSAAAIGNPLAHYFAHGLQTGLLIAPLPTTPTDLAAPSGDAWQESFRARLGERISVQRVAGPTASAQDGDPTFSLLTFVRVASLDHLRLLAESVAAQAFGHFEWLLVLDNDASKALIDFCGAQEHRDPRVRVLRAGLGPESLAVGRAALEQALGSYVVPIDAQDVLYPDTLSLFADAFRASEKPLDLAFGDSQLIDPAGHPIELLWQDAFSIATAITALRPVYALAFRRQAALAADIALDAPAAEDRSLDTILRLAGGNATVTHVPEVVYGRRVLGWSKTARVVNRLSIHLILDYLHRLDLENCFRVQPVTFDKQTGFRLVRTLSVLPSVLVDLVIPFDARDLGATDHNLARLSRTGTTLRVLYPATLEPEIEKLQLRRPNAADAWLPLGDHAQLMEVANHVRPGDFAKVFVTSDVWLSGFEAVSEAVGVLEIDSRAGIVGGPLFLAGGMVLNAGLLAGLDGFVGSLFHGWSADAVPAERLNARRRVSAFPALALCVRASVLREGCTIPGFDRTDAMNGVALCLEAGRRGYTSILDPAMAGEVDSVIAAHVGAGEPARIRLKARFADETARAPISVHLSRCGASYGALPPDDEVERRRSARAIDLWPPLNLAISPDLVTHPTINLLVPTVQKGSLSGGPNTALNIGYRLAAVGFAVRVFSTDAPLDDDLEPIWDHIVRISGGTERFPHMRLVDASDRSARVLIGANDIFFATAWWTARMAHSARDLVGGRPFVYLIQDFEPIFYPASTHYALALETYSFPHLPIINTTLLRDYLLNNRVGLFAEDGHRARTLAFEPAIDGAYFYPKPARFTAAHVPAETAHTTGPDAKRRLLFYARPTNGIRNLFDIGVAALRGAIREHVLDAARWDFVAMGERIDPVDLDGDARLSCAPWLGFEAYAEQLRGADIILSLMLSPHPSYPPLEMAACGNVAVTNTYANKTATAMGAVSGNVIAAEPTVPAIIEALTQAVARLDDLDARLEASHLNLPATWDSSFADPIRHLSAAIREQGVPSDAQCRPPSGEPSRADTPVAKWGSPYAAYLEEAAVLRSRTNAGAIEPGLFSFVTVAWNTPPVYLDVLAESLDIQIGGTTFEWIILDNGSTRDDTQASLRRLSERSYVRVTRVPRNLGIIGGARRCLEEARNRYILPLDHDDYIYPDCVRTLTWYVHKHGYPALLYTDEDKLIGDRLDTPLRKPDWDPVLFSAQCYTSHLCVIDRKRALELDAYGDPATEGSPDWDVVARFWNAGHTPIHIPHILYSWRMHAQSTAGGNIKAKPYVFDSQRAVLNRLLSASPCGGNFEIVLSPLFDATPDWWIKRRRTCGRKITTILIHSLTSTERPLTLKLAPDVEHDMFVVARSSDFGRMREIVEAARAADRLVHLVDSDVRPDNDEWAWEAIGLFERFPDTVMVGGFVHAGGFVLDAGRYLGFDGGCGSRERGRPVQDPGYSAQALKPHSVSAVPAVHAVIDPVFLSEALAIAADHGASMFDLGSWIGAYARRQGRRVVYTPFISAATVTDHTDLVSETERQAFLAAFVDQIPDDELLPTGTGLTPETVDIPHFGNDRHIVPTAALPEYDTWFHAQLARRLKIPVAPSETGNDSRPLFSLITPVYINTDADFFAITAHSVTNQTFRSFEWIILAQGPISTALDDTLRRLSVDKRVRIERIEINLGIIRAMRRMLEVASATYVWPLDGDDVLTEDAMAVLARAIHAAGGPSFVYTDEDIITGERLATPYLRPDWDSVLDLENSWIWHACVMNRILALDLGVYTDHDAEYCQDWDSVDRFSAAGYQLHHVPEVVYHWRHHSRSTSNREGANTLSSTSVERVLNRKIARLKSRTHYTVAPYPIWRGAEEFWIARDLEDMPPLIALTGDGATAPPGFSCRAVADPPEIAALLEVVNAAPDDAIVGFIGSGISEASGDTATREIVKIFDIFDDAVVVTGRVLCGDCVLGAGLATDATGSLTDLLGGRPASDAGPFALALKPFTIAVPFSDWFFARSCFLRETLETLPDHASLGELALWLGARAAAARRRVVYNPLVTARTDGTPLYAFERRATNLAWQRFQAAIHGDAIPTGVIQGNSAYSPARTR